MLKQDECFELFNSDDVHRLTRGRTTISDKEYREIVESLLKKTDPEEEVYHCIGTFEFIDNDVKENTITNNDYYSDFEQPLGKDIYGLTGCNK